MKQEDKTYEVRDNKYFYDGNLNIVKTDDGYLPDNLTISGSLYIDNSPRFKTLPKNLTVKQNLYLRHTPIKTLPSGLNVGECLEMEHSKITSLPEDLKTAITLRELEGLSYEEIAEIMDCPVGTVRSRIFRAREIIENKIQPLMQRE